jgi:hypothetical protein
MDDPILKCCKFATRGPLGQVASDREAELKMKARCTKGFRFG